MRSANQNWSLCAAHTANSYGSVGIHTRQHSRLIRDVRRGHSRGPPPSLLGVAAMARGQLTLEHARGPQRVEDRSVRSGGRGHSDVVHASQRDLRGSDPDILHTRGGSMLSVCPGQGLVKCQ